MIQKILEGEKTNATILDDNPHVTEKQRGVGGRGIFIGMAIGVILTLGGTKLLSKPETTDSSDQLIPEITTTEAPATSVTVANVTSSVVNRTLKATGTVAAFELIPVLSQATGVQIQQILAEEGEFVQQGQVLAHLDDAVLQAQLAQAQASVAQAEARLAELKAGTRLEDIEQAKANVNIAQAQVKQAESDLNLAQKRVKRNQNLEAEGAIAQDRLDEVLNEERNRQASLQQAQARLREEQQQLAKLQVGERQEVILQAQAQLAQAKAQRELVTVQLKNTRVLAPVRGKIAERNARVGDTTNSFSQTPLFQIIEDGRLELQLKVPETQLNYIKVSQSVNITSDADSSFKLMGKIREIAPLVDEESRQVIVKVDLPVNNALKPGMFLQATITTAQVKSLTAPMSAILPQADGKAIAYVVQPDNTVKEVSVTMGEILPNEQVEIKSGLQTGDRIVVKGAAYLKAGDTVIGI